MQDRRKFNILKNVVAKCYNKTLNIARIFTAPFNLADTFEKDLKNAKVQKNYEGYPKDGITFTLDDDFLQTDLQKRIDFLRSKNARNLVEQYSNEYIKKTLEKDNYLIGYNQAIPYAVARINNERSKGLLDDFYLPVEKGVNGDDKRNFKRG